MKTFVQIAACCLLTLVAHAQTHKTSQEEPLLTVQQLTEDFTRFRTALEQVHPEMYRYTPKRTYDSLFSATAGKLNQPMSRKAFFVTMNPLVAALHCGHTKWLVSGRDEHYPFHQDRLFPIKLYFVGDKAWVVANYGSGTIPAGAEVVSVNGQPIASVIRQLLPWMTFADGNTINGKYADLNEFFSGFYATYIGAPASFDIVYKSNGGEKIVTLPAISEKTIKDAQQSHKPAPQKPFRLTFTDNQTAIMTIERFWGMGKAEDYKTFLKESFQQLKEKQVQNLVLDLRNNEGGEEAYGVLLYSYLAQKPFRYYDHISIRQKEKFSFSAWTPKFYGMLRHLIKKTDEGYVWPYHTGVKEQKPQRDAFHGKLYVLLNGSSFSVTTEFAARTHADGRATFIGQETGGGYKVNSSGVFTIVQLPHSKLDLGIPMFGFHMAGVDRYPHDDRGIIPDHTVVPTIDDIISGHDRVMHYTLQLVQPKSAGVSTANLSTTK
ncbi:S41 family peptidase [Nibrella saemangeumensis]|uniref:S41 family peptidase n=1 Tax=Nibrella saemangeumensis TaxID=1084526 RepID=A0ABP8MR64_9BACT